MKTIYLQSLLTELEVKERYGNKFAYPKGFDYFVDEFPDTDDLNTHEALLPVAQIVA